jgi:putative peptide zinc metalloprotease protein
MTDETLTLNPAVEVSPLDASGKEPMVLCSVPRANGSSARYAVPQAVVELLRLFDGTRTTAQVIEAYARVHPGRHGGEAIVRLVGDYLLPRRLLLDSTLAAAPASEAHAPDDRKSYLTFKVRLLSGAAVYPVVRLLGWMFRRPVFVGWMALVAAVHVLLYARIAPDAGLDLAQVTGIDVLLVALMTTVSVFVHELGHASAAVHYGCRRTEIGWGMYLWLSVFWTDVSEAWKLPRTQRAVVDLSGIYFQSVFMGALLAAYLATGQRVWLYGILASDVGIAHSLNPFLRMDGYWLVSDLFGIVNLRAQTGRLLQVGVARVTRLFRPVPVPAWGLGRRTTWVLSVYTLFSLGFFLYIYEVLVRFLVVGLLRSFPGTVGRLYALAAAPAPRPWPVAGAALEVLWRGLMLFGVGLFCFRILRSTLRWLAGARRVVLAPLAGGPPAAPVGQVAR